MNLKEIDVGFVANDSPYTVYYVYTRDEGNFIIKGSYSKVIAHLKSIKSPYFYRYTFWMGGKSRGGWRGSNGIRIYEKHPFNASEQSSNCQKRYYFVSYVNHKPKLLLKVRRIPHRWVKELDVGEI